MNEIKVGDRINTVYDYIETVVEIDGVRVITEESREAGNWYHVSKVRKVEE